MIARPRSTPACGERSPCAGFSLRHGLLQLKLDLEPDPVMGRSGDLATELGDVLVAVAEAAARRSTALLLTVDEVQAMPAAQMGPLFAALQRTARTAGERGDRLPLLTVLAGLPGARAAMRKASSTYAERVRAHRLELLDEAAVTEALVLPAEERGASYAPEALELLLPEIGGYPYFVQLVGYEAWQVASAAGKERIDGDVARAAAAAARRQARALYDSRLEEVPDAERRFLEAAALVAAQERTTAAVAMQLGGTSEAWGWARRRLMDRGLIRTGPRGRIVFALPGLDQHLREG